MLFGAAAVLPSENDIQMIALDAASRDFVGNAFAHCKFIGVARMPSGCLTNASAARTGRGFLPLTGAKRARPFATACHDLRFWPGEMTVDHDTLSVRRG